MLYELLNKDEVIAVFDVDQTAEGGVIPGQVIYYSTITRTIVRNAVVYDNVVGSGSLQQFLEARRVPQGRAYMKQLFTYLRLDDLKTFLDITLGLSMTDTFWVRPADSELTWAKVNLFDHALNDTVAKYALNGAGKVGPEYKVISPEYNTDGNLPKAWVREKKGPHLYKGSTAYLHYANTGYEPFAEFYAAKIAKRMALYDYVDYGLRVVDNALVSDCRAFTSKDLAYIPMSRALGIESHTADWRLWLRAHGLMNSFTDILFFDCLVCNPDRHLGNFGPMMETETYTIKRLSPIFDNGMSLGQDWMPGRESIFEWANHAGPCNIKGSYVSIGKGVLDDRRRAAAERLRGWTIPKHPKYNWSEEKYEAMNELLQHQVKAILS